MAPFCVFSPIPMTYNRKNIAESLDGLIGFMPSYDASNAKAKIDDDLSESLSGEYVNGLHPAFTPEIFSSTAQKFWGFVVREWQVGASYAVGSVVQKANVIYQALAPTTGNDPATSPTQWKPTTLLSVWFRDKYRASAYNLLSKLSERKKLEGHGREYRGKVSLYNAGGASTNVIAKSSRFVGFQIEVKQDNLAVQMMRIGMQLTEQATVPIHIITDEGETIINVTFPSDEGKSIKYKDVDVSPFFSSNSGTITVGYYEDDLGPASAVAFTNSVFSQNPCYGCGRIDSTARFAWDPYIKVIPFSEKDDVMTANYESNYGLNLVFSFHCDLSDLLIRQKMMLVDALKAQLKMDFMIQVAGNVRNNQEADTTQMMLYTELKDFDDPENPKIALDRAVKALVFNISDGSICLQCDKKVRIVNKIM